MVIETMRRGRSGRALVILALAVLLAPGAAGAQSGLQYESAFDLVWGNGSKGPYSLSRQAVVPGSVTVRLNGNRELLPADYQLDHVAGKITFTQPLDAQSIARVDYAYDKTKSAVNVIPLNAPLSLDVAQMQMGGMMSSTLRLSSVWRPDAGGAAEMAAVGMGLDAKIGSRTQLGTILALSPNAEGSGLNTLDAAALQLTGQTTLQRMQANVKYARTGAAFGAAQEYGLTSGIELLDLATTYTLSPSLSARSGLQRTEELSTGGAWTRRTTQINHVLTANLSPASRLTLARNTQQVEMPEGLARDAVTDQIVLEQRLGKATTAWLRREIAVVEADGSEQTTALTGLKLDTQLAANTRIVAERVEAQTEDLDPAVSTQVDLTTGNNRMKLQGQFAQKEGPGLTPEEVHTARVEATPLGGLKIGGGVQQRFTGTNEQLLKDALVELNPLAGFQIVGRLNEQADGSGLTVGLVRSVDARLRPFQALELSGTYKEREQGQQAGPLTRGLNVSLAPAKYFQLTGGLIENPEEEGLVRAEERRTLGLRSDIGAFSLSGSYAQRLTTASLPLAEELQVGLAIRLSPHDRLFSSYKIASDLGNTQLSTAHYGFGYNRSVGNTFGLSLEGEYLQRIGDSLGSSERGEARAKAGINARF